MCFSAVLMASILLRRSYEEISVRQKTFLVYFASACLWISGDVGLVLDLVLLSFLFRATASFPFPLAGCGFLSSVVCSGHRTWKILFLLRARSVDSSYLILLNQRSRLGKHHVFTFQLFPLSLLVLSTCSALGMSMEKALMIEKTYDLNCQSWGDSIDVIGV